MIRWRRYWLLSGQPPVPFDHPCPQILQPGPLRPGFLLIFGKESAGLPEAFRQAHEEECVRIPMVSEARSLNLANSVSIVLYEALRQNDFDLQEGTI